MRTSHRLSRLERLRDRRRRGESSPGRRHAANGNRAVRIPPHYDLVSEEILRVDRHGTVRMADLVKRGENPHTLRAPAIEFLSSFFGGRCAGGGVAGRGVLGRTDGGRIGRRDSRGHGKKRRAGEDESDMTLISHGTSGGTMRTL